jgi:uncharacterized protein with PIN domain
MLGSLARWLRFFGYDAEFGDPSHDDSHLADRARDEGRWLLTRDRGLASLGPRTVLIRADELEGQLVEVFLRLDLRPESGLDRARCGECNGELEPVEADQVAGVVPPYVFRTAERFKRCNGCGRVYWPGSHSGRILETMQAVLDALREQRGSATLDRGEPLRSE